MNLSTHLVSAISTMISLATTCDRIVLMEFLSYRFVGI